ncbi:AzlD domain-containing protein [Desulfatiferula olefinivorans]
MPEDRYLFLVLGMGLVTFAPRFFPVFFLTGKSLPEGFKRWLELIPVALLSAILLPSLVVTRTPMGFTFASIELLVAIPTVVLAAATRSLSATIIGGMLMYWMAGKIGG